MFVQILVDNPDSWILPYADELVSELTELGHNAILLSHHKDVQKGDILCLLSCEKIFKKLELNKHNLVVHESDLPKGRGWSPVTWQILKNVNRIPVTLFEATQVADAGNIYLQDFMELDGTELLFEIKHKQGIITKKLIKNFIIQYLNIKGKPQKGKPTHFARRSPEDSQLNIAKNIKEQFNLLRVCDNKRYPAFFVINGIKYIIRIGKK